MNSRLCPLLCLCHAQNVHLALAETEQVEMLAVQMILRAFRDQEVEDDKCRWLSYFV